MKRIFLVLSLLIFLFCCCGKSDCANTNQPPIVNEALVRGNNIFALKIYSELNKKNQNTFFSPYSISTAFAMVYAGASGQTAKEMSSIFEFHLTSDVSFNPAFKDLQNTMNAVQSKNDVKLNVANALFISERSKNDFKQAYINLVKENYNSELLFLNFLDKINSANVINKWVDNKTNHKISKLVDENFFDALTTLILVDAIYFKGEWLRPFDIDETRKDDFYAENQRTNAKIEKVMMMHSEDNFQYADTDSYQMIELPYKGNDISMLVLLPKNMDDMPDLEKQLTNETLEQWKSHLSLQKVNVFIPKFKLEKTYDNMENTLIKMGMITAFGDQADFSKMKVGMPLHISKVIHKSFIEVNEKGTEAAAATVIGMSETMAPPHRNIPVFRADHPFIYIIQHKPTGSILFMGKMQNPNKN